MALPFADLDPAAYALPTALTERLLSPALVVWLDRVRANVTRMLAHTGGPDRWRPHVKTTKLAPVWRELARAGVHTYKCATLREAELLLVTLAEEDVPAPDLLLAYPLVGPSLSALGELAARHPEARVSVLVEDEETATRLGAAGLSGFVDVNPGMHRTGLPHTERAAIAAVARALGPRLAGLHWYDGHLHGDPSERRAEVFAGYDALMDLLAELDASGLRFDEVVTSGTPTFLHALAYPRFRDEDAPRHRVSPGTVVFHDLRSEEENPGLGLAPAALLFARVVSHPRPGHATLDAGSKSIAAEAGDPCAFVLGHPDARALAPSEEHLPLAIDPAPPRGTGLLLVPRHVCPTVNLAEEVVLMDGGRFVGTAEVAARAHPLFAGD